MLDRIFQTDAEPDVLQQEAAEVAAAQIGEAEAGTALLPQLEVVRLGMKQQAELDAAQQRDQAAGEVAMQDVAIDPAPETPAPDTAGRLPTLDTLRRFIDRIAA